MPVKSCTAAFQDMWTDLPKNGLVTDIRSIHRIATEAFQRAFALGRNQSAESWARSIQRPVRLARRHRAAESVRTGLESLAGMAIVSQPSQTAGFPAWFLFGYLFLTQPNLWESTWPLRVRFPTRLKPRCQEAPTRTKQQRCSPSRRGSSSCCGGTSVHRFTWLWVNTNGISWWGR